MTLENIDDLRRRFLVGLTALLASFGAAASSLPFVRSLLPSKRARALGADVEVDLSDLEPGRLKTVEWRGRPVWILRRTPEMLERMRMLEYRLKDPESKKASQQPAYARNWHRSINEEYLVVVGICTHLGCVPTFRPEPHIREIGNWWEGGFYCPCHQSEYDFSGRVFKGRSPAPKNLLVPPHQFVTTNYLIIGNQSV